jgi:[ribosomal protein S5]-alanine N-acetyltransferase
MSVDALPILTGARVVLRPSRPTDREDRFAAGRDPEFHRLVGGRSDVRPWTAADADRWYEAINREPYAWIVEFQRQCIGSARLHQVDPGAGSCLYAVGIFRPDHRGLGLGTEITRLVLDYAFGALGLNYVRLRVLDFNDRAIACYRRCGFVEVAREPVRLGRGAAIDVVMEARRTSLAAE